MNAPQKRARIATMAEPDQGSLDRAIVVAAYQARESLSLAERLADVSPTCAIDVEHAQQDVTDAIAFLGTCLSLLRNRGQNAPNYASHLAKRAIEAAKAAGAHGAVALSYAVTARATSDGRPQSEFDAKMAHKAQRHWFKATEAARQEAHRVLAELAELYPEAYEVEEL